MRKDPVLFATIILLWVLLGLFIIYPIAMVVAQSLSPHGTFSLEVYKRIFTKVYFRRPFFNSLKLGATVAFIGVGIAYIFAYIINRTDVPLKRFFRTIATMPIVSPPFALALALILLFGRNGVITRHFLKGLELPIYGFWGLVIVETMAYFPTAFLTLDGILKSIDPALEEASMSLGAGKGRVFWTVTFPLSMPGILSDVEARPSRRRWPDPGRPFGALPGTGLPVASRWTSASSCPCRTWPVGSAGAVGAGTLRRRRCPGAPRRAGRCRPGA